LPYRFSSSAIGVQDVLEQFFGAGLFGGDFSSCSIKLLDHLVTLDQPPTQLQLSQHLA
jgi:hypothetical protein